MLYKHDPIYKEIMKFQYTPYNDKNILGTYVPIKLKLYEKYHNLTLFDGVINDIYNLILPYIKSIYSKPDLLKKYINKIKFINYEFDKSNNLIFNDNKLTCFKPIYIKIVSSENYIFAIERYKNNNIIILCNLGGLCLKFNEYIFKTFEFERFFKSSLKHELLHIFQQQKDINFDNKTFNKIEKINNLLNNYNISLSDKNDILLLFKYALFTEQDAVLNAITKYLTMFTKEQLFNKINEIQKVTTYKITLNIIHICAEIVSEQSKLPDIILLLNKIKNNKKLETIIYDINNEVKIINETIVKYFKRYESKIFKQIYYILHYLIKFDENLNEITIYDIDPKLLDFKFMTS